MVFLVVLVVVFLMGCGAKTYTPDYTVMGKRFGWGELPKSFKSYTESVKWLKRRREWRDAEVSTENWDVVVVGNELRATHLPTGRTYRVKMRIPFPMVRKGVVKEASGGVLYVKEPLDGKVYVLDPRKEEKEVGVLRRAYLYDDGIAVVVSGEVRFCKDYDTSKCKTLYRLGERGEVERFHRINGAFTFYVEDYRWNERERGYRWFRGYLVYTPEGEKIAELPFVSVSRGFHFPFWEEIDKGHAYAREDSSSIVPYENFTPPALYVEGTKIYYFAHGQKERSFKDVTEAVVVENGKEVFKKVKETTFFYASYSLGFCGEKILVMFDDVWYDPETGKKVACSTGVQRIFSF